MRDKFFLLLGIVIISWSFYAFLQKPVPVHYQKKADGLQLIANGFIQIGDKTILVEIADTDEERSRGLSGREVLETGHGMLFLFPKPSLYGFWMKDMKFPIDIVWINEEHIVVGVKRLVNPDTYPELFYPPVPVKYVLEINYGEASRLGIDTGTRVFLGTEN